MWPGRVYTAGSRDTFAGGDLNASGVISDSGNTSDISPAQQRVGGTGLLPGEVYIYIYARGLFDAP